MKITVSPHTASRIIEGQAYIINTKTSTLHELDELGTVIWKLLEKNLSVEKIAAHICDSYEVSPSAAVADVTEFIEKLAAKGLIVLET